MSEKPVFYFCRSCGYRGQFVAKPEHEVECPQCHDHGRPKAIMRRQDVSDLTKETAQ